MKVYKRNIVFTFKLDVKFKIYHSTEPQCDPNVLGSRPSSLSSAGSLTVNNGVIDYNGVLPGSMAHLVCDEGFTASVETRDRTCLCNSSWSGKIQVCGHKELGKYVGIIQT